MNKGFILLEIQKQLNLNFGKKAKSPFGSIFSITNRSEKLLTGFTILEVILAIFILTTAAFSSFNLIQQVISAGSLNESRLIAYYLAQEGVENIRNIRDKHWIDNELNWIDIIFTQAEQGAFNESGIFNRFNREIKIEKEVDHLKIEVIVSWTEKNRSHDVKVISYLYNWLNI